MADFDIDIGEIAEEDPYTVQGGMRNYVDDEGMATVPRNWKSRPGQPETQLAYITGDEATLLREANVHNKADPGRMGTVNVGPDGVPSYDDSGVTDYEGFSDPSGGEVAENLAAVIGEGDTSYVPPSLLLKEHDAQRLQELNPDATNIPGLPYYQRPGSVRNVMGILTAMEADRREREYIQQSINRLTLGNAGAQSSLTEPEDEKRGEITGRGPIDQFMGWAYKDWIPKGGQVKERTTGHSSDYGITGLHGGDAGYRDPDVGAVIGSALMMSPVGVVRALAKNQYLADPARERAEAMKAHTSSRYGPSWLYGQPKPKAKDYGDGGDHPLLKKRLPIGAVPSAPQGIVSGDPIFSGRTKTFRGFNPNPEIAGARGAFRSFDYSNPVVAQRGGLLDAAEIQRFQSQGVVKKPDPRLPSTGFLGKVLSGVTEPIADVFRTDEEKSEKQGWSDNPFEQTFFESQKPDPEPRWRAAGNALRLPLSLLGYVGGELGAAAKLPGAVASKISQLMTSDPVVGPDYSSLDPAQETQMRNTAAQMARFLGTTPSHHDTGLADVRYDEDLGYATLDGAAIDTTSGLNRGGAIRSSDLAGDYGTMNRMISDPTGIASLGRGGDTMLVHMRPDEVAAMSRDGRTTVNPHTGLPERFWGATLGGLAGSFLGPWGVGIGSGLGQFAQQKLMGRSTGDALQQGLYTGALAGLGTYGLGEYAAAGHKVVDGVAATPNWLQTTLGKPGTTDALFGLPGSQVNMMTAGLGGMGGSMLGEMAAPPLAPPKEELIEQPQAIARPKSARGLSGDPATYGSGAEQYLLSRNKGIFDYTFAQEGGLMEAAQEEEVVETSPDGVEMAYLQEDAEVMTPPGIPGMEEGMDIIVKEAVMAIRGEHPQPERAIAEYIEIYGEEDFAALQEMVTQDQALQGMGEAPVQVAEASETVEEMPLMAARGGALNGPGKGRDDQIPVLASDGEYIIAADVVSGLGDGSTKAGAQTLDAMADRVRQMRTGTQKQPEILPEEMALPA